MFGYRDRMREVLWVMFHLQILRIRTNDGRAATWCARIFAEALEELLSRYARSKFSSTFRKINMSMIFKKLINFSE